MITSEQQQMLEKAFELQQSGQVDAAIACFQTLLKTVPDQPDALHGLGLAYAQKQDYHQAISLMKRAIDLQPDVAPFHNNLGNAYKAIGKLDEAVTHYRQALRLRSNYAEAHNNLGNIYYLLGQWDNAIAEYEKALRIAPQAVDTHFNLANSYVQCERFLDAVAHYEAVLKAKPEHQGANHNAGIAYCFLKRYEEAKPLLMKALERDPDNLDLLYHFALTQGIEPLPDNAIATYRRIIAINPKHAQAQHNLATLLLRKGDKVNALTHYEKALEYQPENATAAHMVAALKGQTSPEGAPLAYTQALFDQYAYNYNQHVKDKLHYQVPALLRQLITPFLKNRNAFNQAADLGCGTGLCAPFFIDSVKTLVGVDISPNMIEIARQLGAYKTLTVEDIVSFLKRQPNAFDLIIAADVFTYFGDLQEVFQYCLQALHPDGFFVFSIEKWDEKNAGDYVLQPTGRYAHHASYINALAQRNGFEILAEETHPIRYQDENPIEGNVYLLRKTL